MWNGDLHVMGDDLLALWSDIKTCESLLLGCGILVGEFVTVRAERIPITSLCACARSKVISLLLFFFTLLPFLLGVHAKIVT